MTGAEDEQIAVQVEQLSFSPLPGGPDVLKQVTFSLPRGSRCAVVGPNGAGKSTLLELLSGGKMAPAGALKVCGEDPFRGRSGRQVSLVQGGWRGIQAGCMDSSRVREIVGGLADTGEAAPPRARRLREALGLGGLLERFFGSLSDGERRRVELGRRLAEPSEVVLLDEATADLDILARRAVLDFLREDGATVLNVTHVFDSMDPWASHVLQLHAGALVRCEAAPAPGQPGGLFAHVSRWIAEARAADPDAPLGAPPPPPAAVAPPANATMPAVDAEGVAFAYADWCPTSLRLESLRLPLGCRAALVGLNGAGKSSLLAVLAGRRLVPNGQVRVLGHRAFHDHQALDPIVALLSTEWKKQVSEMSSARSMTFWELADAHVRDLVSAGGDMAVIAGRMLRLVQSLGVDTAKPLGTLSDGMLRRAQIALKLLRPSRLLLVDEVTADLDVPSREAVLSFLREESEAGCAVVYCTHVLDGLSGWATHLLRARPKGRALECTLLGDGAGRLEDLVVPKLLEDAELEPEAGVVLPPAPKGGGAELPLGWEQRGATMASAYGDYAWNAERGPEDTWSFASVSPNPGALPKQPGPGPAAAAAGPLGCGPGPAALPSGWDSRRNAQAGSFGGYSWGAAPGGGPAAAFGGHGGAGGGQGF
ncbi:unnamed protein product [Prorocentrum cordatum]|uniref:ABC transporter domain-containing protein n=1 Tax=Prorocentrum cordatum TaxID=2364126 RepID=A0ABN9WZC8_9DINO|nr:unnamed protein product [Polarella glacialis]